MIRSVSHSHMRRPAVGGTAGNSYRPGGDRSAPDPEMRRELDYRLIKEIYAFRGNRIAVRRCGRSAPPAFASTTASNWFRSYSNADREFDENGLCAYALPHQRSSDQGEERRCHWPLGRRPEDHVVERSPILNPLASSPARVIPSIVRVVRGAGVYNTGDGPGMPRACWPNIVAWTSKAYMMCAAIACMSRKKRCMSAVS